MDDSTLFLTEPELRTLTGRCQKRLQVDQLRQMGVPFHLNASNHPVVTRAAVEGGKAPKARPVKWAPRLASSR